MPSIAQLVRARANAGRGEKVFNRKDTCAQCHVVSGKGKAVGPDLSEIGSKLSKEALFESILFPSAGISHNYESYVFVLKSGATVNGIVRSESPQSVSVVAADGITREIKPGDIVSRVKQETSLMPADLQKLITAQELVDLVAYLERLKKK